MIAYIYDGVIKPTLGTKAKKFAPYLLTVFFFILTMNLLGLVVIFPGGANLTGNIAVTLVLSVCTFLMTNLFGTKHYWKDIFWPDVPLWLKFPIPIMPVIEVFGVFTKPAALTVPSVCQHDGRSHDSDSFNTANIHFHSDRRLGDRRSDDSCFGCVFVVYAVDRYSCELHPAYVFTMLSTLFISLAQAGGEHEAVSDGEAH